MYFQNNVVLLGESPNIAAKKYWSTVDLKNLVVFELDCGFLLFQPVLPVASHVLQNG